MNIFFPKKIPTLVGIFIVILLLVGASVGVEYATRFQTNASATVEPKNITVTNMTDTSFSVIWETLDPSSGFSTLEGGKGPKTTAFDERDTKNQLTKYTTHSVTFKNLSPSTSYTLTVYSNGKKYFIDGKPFTVKTPTQLPKGQNIPLDPAYGVVKTPEGKAAAGAIVLFSVEDSQTMSALIKPSGSWIIPLTLLRSKNLDSFIPVRERMAETITISLNGQKITVLTDTLNDSPVPEITLGENSNYDFRNREAKNKSSPVIALASSPTPAILGDQTTNSDVLSDQEKNQSISISAPKDGAALTSNKPLFQGTGIVGKTVHLTIEGSSTITGSTVVTPNALWQFTPSTNLLPEKYKFTLSTTNDTGKTVNIIQTFSILKSGSQVLGDATPSATLTPTIEATPSPTSTLSGEPMPEPGTTLPTIVLLVVGIVFLAGGAFIVMK